MQGLPVLSLLRSLWQARSVRTGGLVVAVSALAFVVWERLSPIAFCEVLARFERISGEAPASGLLILFLWSLILFCTVLPLGTLTVLIGGYLLGPVAGIAQFGAVLVSSLILFEIGRETQSDRLARRLESYPALTRWVAAAEASGLWISIVLRLAPVVPSATAALAASFLQISRREFMLATLLAGWVRPVGFAVLGSLGRFVPVCGIGVV